MQYTREFVHGTCGDDVRAFQENLLVLGYKLPQWGADGCYGGETEAAARNWCHDGQWDHCWDACPVWVQEKVEASSEPPGETSWMPLGKGMFIQSFNSIDGPEEVEAVVREVGIKWVCIQALWQFVDKPSKTYNWPEDFGLKQSYGCSEKARQCVDKFHELGVVVLPFAYPVPGKEDECVQILEEYAEEWDSPSVVIDPEAPYKSDTGEFKAAALLLSAKMDASFDSWGMTTFGATWFHPDFPYQEFNKATYGMGQTYTKYWLLNDRMARSHKEWRAFGFRNLVTLYGTYSITASELSSLLQLVESMKTPATAGWKWGSTSEIEWDLIEGMIDWDEEVAQHL